MPRRRGPGEKRGSQATFGKAPLTLTSRQLHGVISRCHPNVTSQNRGSGTQSHSLQMTSPLAKKPGIWEAWGGGRAATKGKWGDGWVTGAWGGYILLMLMFKNFRNKKTGDTHMRRNRRRSNPALVRLPGVTLLPGERERHRSHLVGPWRSQGAAGASSAAQGDLGSASSSQTRPLTSPPAVGPQAARHKGTHTPTAAELTDKSRWPLAQGPAPAGAHGAEQHPG